MSLQLQSSFKVQCSQALTVCKTVQDTDHDDRDAREGARAEYPLRQCPATSSARLIQRHCGTKFSHEAHKAGQKAAAQRLQGCVRPSGQTRCSTPCTIAHWYKTVEDVRLSGFGPVADEGLAELAQEPGQEPAGAHISLSAS